MFSSESTSLALCVTSFIVTLPAIRTNHNMYAKLASVVVCLIGSIHTILR